VDQVRIGALGAARITPAALVRPAGKVSAATVTAVAARDPVRGRAFADKHGVERVHDSYAELIADPDIDAVYIALPNGLHHRWTMAAIEARKHVLCEKPFTSNAPEAEEVAKAAESSGLVVMEAFHYRYHPLAERMRQITTDGTLGGVRHIETALCFPLLNRKDIRYQLELAGGATMDAGCYAIHMLRTLAGAEPEVVSAQAKLASPQVDRWMRAEMSFADGRTGRITAALMSARLVQVHAKVTGDEGEMRVFNPVGPHFYHRLVVRTRNARRTEHLSRESTYLHQLRAFTGAIIEGTPVLTPPSDAVGNMRVIDAVYERAGLEPRISAGQA
jgi:predicted dehydrogenase